MRLRDAALAGLGGVVGLALLPAVPTGAASVRAEPTLAVEPRVVEVPADVTVTGTCDPGDDASPTTATTLLLDLVVVAEGVELVEPPAGGGDPGFRLSLRLPADLPPGTHQLETTCGGRAPLVVLAAPVIELTPDRVEPGSEVGVTGSCPIFELVRVAPPVELFLDGEPIGLAPLDPRTQTFGPLPLPVPEDIGAGPHRVESGCGGAAILTVLLPEPPQPPVEPPVEPPQPPVEPPQPPVEPPVEPPVDPPQPPVEPPVEPPQPPPQPPVEPPVEPPVDPPQPPVEPPVEPPQPPPQPPVEPPTPPVDVVEVPDLGGLTEEQAVARLGDELVLVPPEVPDGVVSGQQPPPGSLVERGSAVTVALETASGERPALLTWLLGAVAALAVAAGGAFGGRGLRRWRQRRWVGRHVGTELRRGPLEPATAPARPVPALDIRLEVRPRPGALLAPREVDHGQH